MVDSQKHAGAHRYALRAIVCRERPLALGKLTALRTLTSTTVEIIIIITVVVVVVVAVVVVVMYKY